MSAETLRRASALMRERAEGATPAPWCADGADVLGASNAAQIADCFDLPSANGSHIASWHPAVALAVADWLDSTANDVEHVHTPVYNLTSTTVARAVAVAETYLALAHPSTDPDG